MKYLQTKPQNENMNKKDYDFYFTVIKKRDEKEEENMINMTILLC